METKKLITYLGDRFGGQYIFDFIEKSGWLEDESELKTLIKETKNEIKQELQRLPGVIRIITKEALETRGNKKRAQYFAEIVFSRLPKTEAQLYKDLLARSMVTPETPDYFFESSFVDKRALPYINNENDLNDTLLNELEGLPFCKDIGKAAGLLHLFDFLEAQAPGIDPKVKALFNELTEKGIISRISIKDFQDVVKKGKIKPGRPKGLFIEAKVQAYVFAQCLGLKIAQFNNCFEFEDGKPLHSKHWKKGNNLNSYRIYRILSEYTPEK